MYRAEQLVFGEWFRQVLLRTDEATARSVGNTVHARQQKEGCVREYLVVLVKRAPLRNLQPPQHDVDK
jgi:hypothetical protein